MEAPRLPSIFRQNHAKQFEFRPRYYDARKERLEKMKMKYAGGEGPMNAENFRTNLGSKWRESRKRGSAGSNVRLVVIMGILFLITYLILFN